MICMSIWLINSINNPTFDGSRGLVVGGGGDVIEYNWKNIMLTVWFTLLLALWSIWMLDRLRSFQQ